MKQNKNSNPANTAGRQTKLEELNMILRTCQKQVVYAQKMISEMLGHGLPEQGYDADPSSETIGRDSSNVTTGKSSRRKNKKEVGEPFKVEKFPTGEEVIEGVFNGVQMIGADRAPHSIPENYASKSKLIEGDILKLTITPQGRFIYKQIGPIERDIKRGILLYREEEDQYFVSAEGAEYRVLKASITYYKGEVGDEVIILTPNGVKSTWAAVDNIVKELPAGEFPERLPQAPVNPKLPEVDEIVEIEEPDEIKKLEELEEI